MFTVPYRAGFAAIEAALNRYRSAVPKGEWYYANVYDPADDSTPLTWWLDQRGGPVAVGPPGPGACYLAST